MRKQLKETKLELRKFQQENKVLEAEKLKFQLQPHTLKNLFAQMNVFAERLNRGMTSLSTTLEYIFYKGNDHFVTIEEEIEFIKKYLELNDLFITEPFAIQMNTEEVQLNALTLEKKIPHLITAYFLENAFKHGDKSHPEFLRVKITANAELFELKVNNKIRILKATPNTTGIGLQNMKKRLDLFARNKYDIRFGCNENDYTATLLIRF